MGTNHLEAMRTAQQDEAFCSWPGDPSVSDDWIDAARAFVPRALAMIDAVQALADDLDREEVAAWKRWKREADLYAAGEAAAMESAECRIRSALALLNAPTTDAGPVASTTPFAYCGRGICALKNGHEGKCRA